MPNILLRIKTRWQYCVECPQYSTRLEALSYLCDDLSGRVQRQQVVKVIWHKAYRQHTRMVNHIRLVAAMCSPMTADRRHLVSMTEWTCASFGLQESTTQTANRSVQPFCTGDRRFIVVRQIGTIWWIRLNLSILRPTGGSAVFAQLTAQSAYTWQWVPLSTRIAPSHGGIWTPCNQPGTMCSEYSRFHPNRLTSGRVIAERMNTIKMDRKPNAIFGFALNYLPIQMPNTMIKEMTIQHVK